MLEHCHALATIEDSVAETMEKLEMEGVNIVYTNVVVWDSNTGVTVLLTLARFLVCIHLTVLLPSLIQGVLVLLFG